MYEAMGIPFILYQTVRNKITSCTLCWQQWVTSRLMTKLNRRILKTLKTTTSNFPLESVAQFRSILVASIVSSDLGLVIQWPLGKYIRLDQIQYD